LPVVNHLHNRSAVTAFDILSLAFMLSSLPAVQRALSWQPNIPPGCSPACLGTSALHYCFTRIVQNPKLLFNPWFI